VSGRGWLPGVGWRAVAADGLAVGAGDLAGAIGVDGQGPAQLVQDHMVVPPTVILEVSEASVPTVFTVDDVMGLAARGRLVAAARQIAAKQVVMHGIGGRRRVAPASAFPSSRMPSHGVYLGGEGDGRQDGRAAPGRHSQQVRVVGHDEHGAYFSGEIQDQIVLVVGAIVYRAGYLGQQPPAAMFGCL